MDELLEKINCIKADVRGQLVKPEVVSKRPKGWSAGPNVGAVETDGDILQCVRDLLAACSRLVESRSGQ